MPQPYELPANARKAPTYNEAVEIVADALIEVREDNRCVSPLKPFDMVNEEVFIIGAATNLMGIFTPLGQAMAEFAERTKALASLWKNAR